MENPIVIDNSQMNLFTKTKEYLWLMRPYNLVYPFLLGLTGAIIASGQNIAYGKIIAATIIPVLGWGFGQYFNDYVGVPEDRINHPYRAIPSGRLAKNEVLLMTLFGGFLATLFCFYFINYFAGLLAIAVGVLCFIYPFAKKYGIFGSITMALLLASPLLFGSLVASQKLSLLAIIAFLSVFFYEIGNNIIFTYQDHEGESAVGIQTLPLQIGLRPAAIVASTFVYIGVAIMWLPWMLGILNWHYLLFFPIIVFLAIRGTIPVIINPNGETGYKSALFLILGFVWGAPAFMASIISPIITLIIIIAMHLSQRFFVGIAHKKEELAS